MSDVRQRVPNASNNSHRVPAASSTRRRWESSRTSTEGDRNPTADRANMDDWRQMASASRTRVGGMLPHNLTSDRQRYPTADKPRSRNRLLHRSAVINVSHPAILGYLAFKTNLTQKKLAKRRYEKEITNINQICIEINIIVRCLPINQ